MFVRQTSFVCAACSSQPAKCYCTICNKLLCLDCGTNHKDNGCIVDSCDLIGISMMKELLKETEGSSNHPGISQTMKNTTSKMRNLFKWLEKKIISQLSECQRKVRTNLLPNEAKQQMMKLRNEGNLTGLYMLCKNIKEQQNYEESKEKVRNEANETKEYQNKMQIILNEFCIKFTEINGKIPIVKHQESKKDLEQKSNPKPQVESNPIPKLKSKVKGILKLSGNY